MRRLCVLILTAAIAGLVVGLGTRPEPGSAAFPGANGKIAFNSDREGHYEVYVINADGSGQTRLTVNAGANSRPSWSPDGTEITFASTRDGNGEVYVMNADGTNQTNRTNHPADDDSPVWCPDGAKIVFTRIHDGNHEVYVMNADGSGQTRLTNSPGEDFEPVCSPDGTKIAFHTVRDGNAEIYLMDPVDTDGDGNGDNPTRLTNTPAPEGGPEWSPDGTKIAFHSPEDGDNEVYVMNADGTGLTRCTNNLAISDAYPAWSPDGTKIAFGSNQDGNPEVYVMNGCGGGQTPRLTNNPAEDTPTDWQPVKPEIKKVPTLVNLWLCNIPAAPGCDNKDGGVEEVSLNIDLNGRVSGTSKGEPKSIGSFEFEVRYDAKLVSVVVERGALFDRPEVDCLSLRGQGFVRFRCVTKGKPLDAPRGPGVLAVLRVRPTADVRWILIANQQNARATQLINLGCQLSDLQGHGIDTGPNSCTDAAVTVRYLEGDIHADCVVDVLDQQQIAFRWDSLLGNLLYSSRMDLEPNEPKQGDGDIDAKDLQVVYGRHESTCKDPHPAQDPVDPKAKLP